MKSTIGRSISIGETFRYDLRIRSAKDYTRRFGPFSGSERPAKGTEAIFLAVRGLTGMSSANSSIFAKLRKLKRGLVQGRLTGRVPVKFARETCERCQRT